MARLNLFLLVAVRSNSDLEIGVQNKSVNKVFCLDNQKEQEQIYWDINLYN